MDAATTSTVTSCWRRRKATGTASHASVFLLISTVLLLASTLAVADCSSQRSSCTCFLVGGGGCKAVAYWTSQISRLPSSILSALVKSFLSPLLRSARVIWSRFLRTVARCQTMLSKATVRALHSLSVWVGQLTRLPSAAMTALLRSFLVPLLRSVRVIWSEFLSTVAQCQAMLLDATGHVLTSIFIKLANAAVQGTGEGLSQLVSSALTGVLRLPESMAKLLTSSLGFFDTTSAEVSKTVGRPRPEKVDASGKSDSKEGILLSHLGFLEWLLAEAGVLLLESYLWGPSRAMWKAGLKLLLLSFAMSVLEDPILRLALSFLSPFMTLFFIPRNE